MQDRIGIAAVSALVGAALYGLIAWRIFDAGGPARSLAWLAGACSLTVYLLAIVLAIELKRWAWQGCYAALAVQFSGALLLLVVGVVRGNLGLLGAAVLGFVALFGALGLWAITRPASRSNCSVRATNVA